MGDSTGQVQGEGDPEQSTPDDRLHKAVQDFALERYKYILQQIHALNENVYKFLAIYQALATTTVGAAVALFVGYKQWGVSPGVARAGVVGLLSLETVVAVFTELLIFIGILAWLDYRKEECELTDQVVVAGFRKRPQPGNFSRWYETYIMAFVAVSTIFMWVYALTSILPAIK
ncbi:hypothetical protein ACFY2W_23170 [Streptomyces sp. NPDC001262]|uniref:hypothetical protein n=1 Tax=Streptomyces sp. NPDC001262 TaxID=3364552 RepID=UPI0036CD4B79